MQPSESASETPVRDNSDTINDATYRATVQRIGPTLRERLRFSHKPGCPVSLGDLRYLRMSYFGFDGQVRLGEMVVHADYSRAVIRVFERLYEARWPISRMRLVDEYDGDDARSMAANNTSGYNCRRVTDGTSLSEHAYGAAVDVNPVQNPYVTGNFVAPQEGRQFAMIDRSAGPRTPPGVIRTNDVVVRAVASIGWEWGGDWSGVKDYQHFSASGN